MRTTLIQNGDICGVQFPREVVERAHLGKELDMEVLDGVIVIRSVKTVRQGWGDAAAACHNAGEDCLEDWDNTVGDQWGYHN